METTQNKIERNPSQETYSKTFFLVQVVLRLMAFVASLIATVVMATNKQTLEVYTFQIQAKFSNSPSFIFLVIGNAIASFYALLSVPFVFVVDSKSSTSRSSFFIFLLDLMIMGLVLAASSAATAIGYVGKKGNSHAGWTPICDQVGKFCDRAGASIVCSYASFVLFFLLLVLSANRSKNTTVASSY
ncbi:CASP-like protein 1F1 [Cinnamomum micranthum f. kanehirae]|uniref:CASP-like protein n=1 Tax=Cinnamomum micranthum f. kanehirae TaxID=337451 RepID=A0A3S3N7U0_9MAGN|nr:CASP-like protein 1F1 [Cinnamomum micranthum f. kanehirae]